MAARWRFLRPRKSMFDLKMQRNQHYLEQIQTRQIQVPFNVTCVYEFFSLIMERTSIWIAAKSDLHQRGRPSECGVFSTIKLKWMSVSQQGANHHQHNLKYGETILKMIPAIKSMRYMNKSYLETEIIQITEWSRGQENYLWNNEEDRVLEPRCHRV